MTPEKWRVVVIMLFATLAVSLGEALLAKGMRASKSLARARGTGSRHP